MSNKVLLKKSSVTSKVPLTSDLDYGELALNYADGKLYFKNSSNVIKSFTVDDNVVTLAGTQTLTNKTLDSAVLTGTLTAGGSVGSAGQVLSSTGTGIQWITPSGGGGAVTLAIAGDTGTDTLSVGTDTLTFTGGDGITSTVTNNTVTLDVDSSVVRTSGSYSNPTWLTSLAYSKLSGAPTNVSSFTNDAGYLTSYTEVDTLDSVTDRGNTTTNSITVGNITATSDVQIDGNLTVSGTTVTVNATNLAVEDNMIYLNNGSAVANPDLGIAGNYNDGTYRHAGFFRDATDGYWKVFKNYTPEPDASAYIDTAHASFALADIQAANFRGALVGNADTVTNGVYTTGSYSNPSWLTSLAYSKLTGSPTLATVATSGSYTDLTNKPTIPWTISGSDISYTTGSVGIGRTPTALLDVYSSSIDGELGIFKSGGSNSYVSLYNSSNSWMAWGINAVEAWIGSISSNVPFGIKTGNVDRLSINTTGDVTIETGNLTLAGTGKRIIGDFSNATFNNRVAFQTSTTNGATRLSVIPNGTSTTSTINLYNNSDATDVGRNTIGIDGTSCYIQASTNGTGTYLPLKFETGGAERVRITTSGGVSFGATGTAYGTSGQVLTSNGDAPPTWQTITSGGSITIGTTAISLNGTSTSLTGLTALSINGTGGSLGVGTASSGVAGEIRATNAITSYYSDERLKTRLGNIDNALEKVMSLSGFYYEANEKAQALGYKSKREVGVSAQEVQAVLPEIVTNAPISDDYLTVYYERLVPLLIEAIKEQQMQIEELKNLLNK